MGSGTGAARRQALLDSGRAIEQRVLTPSGKPLNPDGTLVCADFPGTEVALQAIEERMTRFRETDGTTPPSTVTVCGRRYYLRKNLAKWFAERAGAEFPSGCELFAYYTSAKGYRQPTIGARRKPAEGNYIVADNQFVSHTKREKKKPKAKKRVSAAPPVLATTEELAVACHKAISNAEGFSRNCCSRYAKWGRSRDDWRNYSFSVELNGRRAQVRADYALALAKREWGDGDALGRRPLGAVVIGNNHKQWKLVYKREAGWKDEACFSNIDHVVPEAVGGKTRIANLQVVSCGDNWDKGSDVPCSHWDFADAVASLREVAAFGIGFWKRRATHDKKVRKDVAKMVCADLLFSLRKCFPMR